MLTRLLQLKFDKILNEQVPFVEKKTKIYRAPKPWLNEEVVTLKRKLRKAEHLWITHRQPEELKAYISMVKVITC